MVYTPATAKYPTTIATVADIGLFTNDEEFRLLAATTAATTTFSVDDASGFAAGMWVPIRGINGLEICQITAVQLSPAQITVTRGKDGTVAIAHNPGERGIAGVPAISLNQLVAEVIAIQTFLGTLTTTGFVTLAGAQTITGLKSITDGVRFNIGTTTSATTGGIPGFQHTASSQYLDILTANVRLSDNRLILLTANDGTANEGADLIQFWTRQATDRAKTIYIDHNGNRTVMVNVHRTNWSDSSNHRAYEIKTDDGSHANLVTHFSLQYKENVGDTWDGNISTLDTWTYFDITDYRFRQRSNTAITHNFAKWRDTTSDLFTLFTARYTTDGADGTLIDMDPKTFDNAKNTKWRYFRNVNNTAGGGAATVEWHAGDGTSNVQVKLDLKAGRMSWGDGTAFLADLAHANTAARTYTFPDASTTVAGLSVANVFTANQSISKSNPQITLVDTVNANAGTSTILSQSLGPGMRLAFDLTPNVAGDATNIAFFRSTNNAGNRLFQIYRGDGTSTLAFEFSAATNTFTIGSDVMLVRSAANRLDLATGDSFNLINGNLQFNAVTLFEGDADLAANLVPNADGTLTLGTSARRFTQAFSNDYRVLASASDANPVAQLTSTGLHFGSGGASAVDAQLSRQASSVFAITGALAGSLRLGMSGANVPFLSGRKISTDAESAFHIDGGGILSFGDGGASARDVFIERVVPTANKLIHFGAAASGATGVWVDTSTPGVVLRSPDNNYWRVTIDNAGAITTTSIGASLP